MSATTIIVNDETPRRQYTAAASQTNFDFPFPVFAAGDLQVYKTLAGATPDDTADILTLTTDYTVTGADTQASCVVVLNSGSAAGDIITIIRVVDIARTSDYQIGGDLLAETINREQDTEIMIHQQLREELDRTLRLPITSTVALDAMPNFQAGQYLKVNAAGDAIEYDAGTNANQAAAVETQTLTSGQTSVVFTADVSPAAFYLTGPKVDQGRLTNGDDYTVNAATKTLTLTESYPAGTKIAMVYVDAAADLYSVSSAEVSYAPSGTGAVTTTVEAKLRETVSVKDFGAVGDGVTDDTAAIQAAIDAGSSLVFPEGTYLCGGLTHSTQFQDLTGLGYVEIKKNTNGVLLTSSANDVTFSNIIFNGNTGFTGDCVKTSGDRVLFSDCGATTTNGNALTLTGGANQVIGTKGNYYSDDATGWAIQIGDGVSVTYYHLLNNIICSTSNGGVKMLSGGTAFLNNSQVGDIECAATGSGLIVDNCRVTGEVRFYGSFCAIENSQVAEDVTLGDGSTAKQAVRFGATNFMQSGFTITLNDKIIDSYISTAQLGTGVTVTDNLTGGTQDVGNFIFNQSTSYTPTWTDTTTNPTIGDGSLSGRYFRNGRLVRAEVRLTIGSTTTLGSGSEWQFGLPTTPKSGAFSAGSAFILENGVANYSATARLQPGQAYATVIYDKDIVKNGAPWTWPVGSQITFVIEYETA